MRTISPRRALDALVLLSLLTFAAGAQSAPAPKPPVLDIATVTRDDGMWVSVTEAGKALGFRVEYLPSRHLLQASRGARRATLHTTGGRLWLSQEHRAFVPLRWLTSLGYRVHWNQQANHAVVSWNGHRGLLAPQPKTIAVNLRRQVLFAREGRTVVYKFRVSTGRQGHHTPDGNFRVLRKEPLHISNEYPKPDGGAKMPHALWFTTAYYIHGYHSVPPRPASHGCIRLRLPDAQRLYLWASVGTPVRIYRTGAE